MTGVRLHHSNRLEVLAAELAYLMRTDPGDPFAPERIVVPHPTIGRWLSLELARELGIAANVRFEQPAEFAWSVMRSVVPDLAREQPYKPARLRWRIHDLLPGSAEDFGEHAAEDPRSVAPPGAPNGDAARVPEDAVDGYLRDGDPRKRLELADRLARMYDQCLLYRPDWIREWENGAAPHWQARLWQRVVEPEGPDGAHHWVNALERFRRNLRNDFSVSPAGDGSASGASGTPMHGQSFVRPSPPDPLAPASTAGGSAHPPGWPRRASFFAVPTLSPSYLELLCEVARGMEIRLFLLNPCREYWGDIHSRREIDHRTGDADPDDRYFSEGNELLAAWGRAGRDMFDALVEIPSAEWEERFVAPGGAGRLAALQRDILDLRLAGEAARDGTVLAGDFGENDPDNGPPVGTFAGTPRESAPPAGTLAETPRVSAPRVGIPAGTPPESAPPHTRAPAVDDSLQIHVCHSPLREAEVLHDRLLAVFDAHPDLEPADVLVLTPDLDTYGPAIEAVFAAAGQIPCNVARSRAAESRTLRAFLDLLSLPASRHGAESVLAPLAAPATGARFGIGDTDVAAIRTWVREAGIRWGVDEAHRGEEDLPEIADHTWRHGLHRLLLGYAMADAGEPVAGLVPCGAGAGGFDAGEMDGELLGRFVSYCEKVFGLRARLAGKRRPARWGVVLRDVVRDFFADGSAPVRGAGGREDRALARELADDSAAIRALIRDFENEVSHARSPVPFEVVRDVLLERADGTGRGTARLADGATVAGLGAGWIFPAGVVCVAGMNDGVFPRSPSTPSFDVVAAGRARRGDRDVRREDRFAFLEALLAARRCLIVTYAGRGLRDDAPIPPSVLVDELEDYLQRRFPGETFETRHPLQPFSPRYFEANVTHGQGPAPAEAAGAEGGDPQRGKQGRTETGARDATGNGIRAPGAEANGESRSTLGPEARTAVAAPDSPAGETGSGKDLFSYSRGMCEAARTVRTGTTASVSPSRFAGLTLPVPDASGRCVDLADLVAFFANPTRFFLRSRLGMRLELDDLTLDDEEPFELDNLEHYRLRSDIWDQVQAGIRPERGAALLHGSGRLPQAGLGRIIQERAREEVEPLEGLLAPYRKALDAPPRAIDFKLGEFRVTGAVEHIEHVDPYVEGANGAESNATDAGEPESDRMVWWRTGRLRARDRIEIWLRQLAWAAAGCGPLEVIVVSWDRGAWKSAAFPPPDDAREQLGRWLDAWWQGLAAPLSFFPETSFAFAKAVASVPDGGDANPEGILAAACEKAYVAWLGNPYQPGPAEGSDLYLALAHDADDPLAGGFEDLATKLLVPLARAQP